MKTEGEKRPINRPCSACSAGDRKMEHHDHYPPFRDERPTPDICISCGGTREVPKVMFYGSSDDICWSLFHNMPTQTAALDQLLPSGFYADRELDFRVERMVAQWRKLILANELLELRLETAETRIDNLIKHKQEAEHTIAALRGFTSAPQDSRRYEQRDKERALEKEIESSSDNRFVGHKLGED